MSTESPNNDSLPCSWLVASDNVTVPGASSQVIIASLGMTHIYLIVLILAVFCSSLACLSNYLNAKIHKTQDNIDIDFDAGGRVSAGLTATTIVSQWTWAATLLQSSTVGSKYGISGPFWYAAGATIQILLFAMLGVQLKIRAPGAKTFLQVIKARFGKSTHIVFCAFALLTNIIVTAMLMLGGAAVMTNLVKGLSVELATTLVATVIGTYTFIGGLGATFYVSYFNTAIIYIIMMLFLVKVYHDPGDGDGPIGSVSQIYKYLECSVGPEGNLERSYLTMHSDSGLMFGIINLVGNFGTVFVDQSYWQSSVAAKPKEGVWGFLIGGLVWFAVPFTFATTISLAYISLSTAEGRPLLSDELVNRGLVPPIVAQRLMGNTGEILILIMILMAVTSTGSAEVIAVTSILVYDIYQLYLKPYRLVHDANSCILCGKSRGRQANKRDKCSCISMTFCQQCADDDQQISESKRTVQPEYKCRTHGTFRSYNNYLKSLKNWCLLWTTISIIPLTLILNFMKLSLGWVYLFMGVLIGSAVVPIALCMVWTRLTGLGMKCGSITGAIVGITVWLSVASTRKGGLSNFFESTGDEVTMFAGNIASIMTGGLVTIIVSIFENIRSSGSVVSGICGNDRRWKLCRSGEEANEAEDKNNEVWENTRDIDNPLSPWTELYARDMDLTGANKLDNRPGLKEVSKSFTNAKRVAYFGAIGLTLLLVVVWPSIMNVTQVMSLNEFKQWINISETWGIVAAIFIIIMPLACEIYDILKSKRQERRVDDEINAVDKVKSTQRCKPSKDQGRKSCEEVISTEPKSTADTAVFD